MLQERSLSSVIRFELLEKCNQMRVPGRGRKNDYFAPKVR
jgi:hypothetical protein